jgi:zinc protease
VRDLVPGTERVTAGDVQRAAELFLKAETAFRLVVRPGADTSTAGGAAPAAAARPSS